MPHWLTLRQKTKASKALASTGSMGHVLYQNQDNLDLAQLAWEFMSRFQLQSATQEIN